MAKPAFDTLIYANRLIDAGVDRKHAEAQAAGLGDVISSLVEQLATKAELKEIWIAIKELRSEHRFEVRQLCSEIKSQETRLLYKLAGIMVAGFGLIASLQILMH